MKIDRYLLDLLTDCLSQAARLFGDTARYTLAPRGDSVVVTITTPLPVPQANAAMARLDDWVRLQAVRCDGRLVVDMEYV